MSKIEKEIERIISNPKDFTYDELKKILNNLGFYENNKGRTSGSRVEFKDKNNKKIILHKPHPKNVIKSYQIKDVIKTLKEWGLI